MQTKVIHMNLLPPVEQVRKFMRKMKLGMIAGIAANSILGNSGKFGGRVCGIDLCSLKIRGSSDLFWKIAEVHLRLLRLPTLAWEMPWIWEAVLMEGRILGGISPRVDGIPLSPLS